MKNTINFILIFVMLVSSPIQIFAQAVPFKPAISFEYDYYVAGRTDKDAFIKQLQANLEQDYENIAKADKHFRSELMDWQGSKPSLEDYYNAYGTTEKVKEAYNDFLYFNIYPKESPYYIFTALKEDTDTSKTFRAEAGDVLHILEEYDNVRQDIAELLRKNPNYIQERNEKLLRKAPSIIALTVLGFLNWEIMGAVSAIKTTVVAGKLAKIGLFVALIAADIWITDYVAREAERLDTRLGDLVEHVGFYKIIINYAEDTNLFKAAQQRAGADYDAKKLLKDTRFYRWFSRFEPGYRVESLDEKIENAQAIADFYDKGKIKHTPSFHKLIGETLIMAYGTNKAGIPEITYANKDAVLEQIYKQNSYAMDLVRQEMLRTYYALRFIRAELSNINDPLRYDRAIIDLATTYKIMYVEKIDNTLIKFDKETEIMLFQDALAATKNLDHEVFYEKNPYYQEYQGIDYLEPHTMDGIPYQALEQQKHMEHELSNNREIPTNISYDLADATSTADSYPTLLSRAQVNYIAQLISIAERDAIKQREDEKVAERLRIEEYNKKLQQDFSYLDRTNLTENQKRAVRSGGGTK